MRGWPKTTMLIVTVVLIMLWWSTPFGSAASFGVAIDSRDWSAQLEALDPADPLSYFELAEDVADAAADDRQRDFARHLYALGGVLDPPRLGRSACLALADMENDEHVKRRLLALASLLDRRAGVRYRDQADPLADVDRLGALAVAEAFSHYRNGRGARALKVLGEGSAMELLEAHGHVLRGGAAGFLDDCRQYRSSRKPLLSNRALMTMLRVEGALLAGHNRSWSAELLLTDGRPLIEVDPDHLSDTFGVDASKPYYHHGRWQSRPEP